VNKKFYAALVWATRAQLMSALNSLPLLVPIICDAGQALLEYTLAQNNFDQKMVRYQSEHQELGS
jgi:hypothetical protein